MSRTALVIMCCLAVASSTFASVLTVRVTARNGNVQISVMSKQVTREEMRGVLGKLSVLDKDQLLYVIVDGNVPASALVEVICDVQTTGLHDLVLMSPGEHGGKKGMYQITIDATKRKFGGCIGGMEFESGFKENPEFDKRAVGDPLKKMDRTE